MIATCGFFAALAIWGIPTAVGLFRIRRWARDSVLVIGGAWAMFGLLGLIVTLAMLAVPGAVPPSGAHPQTQNVQTMIKVVIGVLPFLYSIMCAVGVSWLVYFNLTKVGDLFQSAPGKLGESVRPFLISAMAVLSAIRALAFLVSAFLPLPGEFMGIILHGWLKAAVHLVIAALMGAAGFGLWRLLEWGRRTALALQAFGLAQLIVDLIRPSLMIRKIDGVNRIMNAAQPQLTEPFQNMQNVSIVMGILFLISIVGILHHYRAAFLRPNVPLQATSPDLP
jgi:hypothetical protein